MSDRAITNDSNEAFSARSAYSSRAGSRRCSISLCKYLHRSSKESTPGWSCSLDSAWRYAFGELRFGRQRWLRRRQSNIPASSRTELIESASAGSEQEKGTGTAVGLASNETNLSSLVTTWLARVLFGYDACQFSFPAATTTKATLLRVLCEQELKENIAGRSLHGRMGKLGRAESDEGRQDLCHGGRCSGDQTAWIQVY